MINFKGRGDTGSFIVGCEQFWVLTKYTVYGIVNGS